MGTARMLRPWQRMINAALPHLHGHQRNGLADAGWAMAQAGQCQLSKMAVATPTAAKVPSCERRWQRLVANDRLDPQAAMDAWAAWNLADVRTVTLQLDETPQREHLRAMKISRMIGGRAAPLLWWCYRPDALPMRQDQLVLDLLQRTHAALPEGARPILMADRGLSWPAVLDFCVDHGWDYLLRVQSQTAVRFDDGTSMAMADLAPRRGQGWCGRAEVFKTAGWRTTNVVARWERNCDEPWLLITNRTPELRRCRQYRKRMRQEQSFRDEKSHGFHWNDSRIRDPEHASRLLLIMAITMTGLIRLGVRIIREGLRHHLERPDRRTLSVFQLGLRYIQSQLHLIRDPP